MRGEKSGYLRRPHSRALVTPPSPYARPRGDSGFLLFLISRSLQCTLVGFSALPMPWFTVVSYCTTCLFFPEWTGIGTSSATSELHSLPDFPTMNKNHYCKEKKNVACHSSSARVKPLATAVAHQFIHILAPPLPLRSS